MNISKISNKNYIAFHSNTNKSFSTSELPKNPKTYNKKEKIMFFSLLGGLAASTLLMLDRTSKTRLQQIAAEKTKKINLSRLSNVEIEIKSFKDNKNVLSIDDLSGIDSLKDFTNKFRLLQKNKEITKDHGIKSMSSILLWGVPGTGKTSAAKGIAKKLEADFIQLDKELFDSEFVSAGARQFASLIDQIEEHAHSNPEKTIVIFMDEIDGTMSIDKGYNNRHSEDLLNTLKKSISYLQDECDNILFIGATNKDPNGLKSDNAAVRLNTAILSRFNYQFEIGLPEPKNIKDAWAKLIKTKSGKEKFTEKQNELISQKFFELGMSYRDIKNVSNKLNIEDAVEFCKKGSYNSKKNLISVIQNDEKIGYDAVNKITISEDKKKTIIKDLEKSL